MDYKTIEIQTGQGVAVLWLNRPEVRNAFNETMIAELTSAFGELEAHPEVRAVVLAGHGKVFCAGADLNWMKKTAELGFDENRKDAMAFGAMLNRLHALKKPTVARIHGAAFAEAWGSPPPAISPSLRPTPNSACPKCASDCPPRPSVPTSSRRWGSARRSGISSPPSVSPRRRPIASDSCRSSRGPRSWMRR